MECSAMSDPLHQTTITKQARLLEDGHFVGADGKTITLPAGHVMRMTMEGPWFGEPSLEVELPDGTMAHVSMDQVDWD